MRNLQWLTIGGDLYAATFQLFGEVVGVAAAPKVELLPQLEWAA